jgi:hypothetical protein
LDQIVDKLVFFIAHGGQHVHQFGLGRKRRIALRRQPQHRYPNDEATPGNPIVAHGFTSQKDAPGKVTVTLGVGLKTS